MTTQPDNDPGAKSLAGSRRRRVFPILFVQILAANLAVAGAVTLLLYWIFRRLTDAYFHRLMEEFNISPTKLNSMFVEDVEKSLIFGIGLALAIGLALSFLLTKALLRPLSKMARTTENIAAGDFSARAPALKGELGTLAWHFNAMAHTLECQEIGRRQLLRDLSHELRTPLTNLKGYIEGLQDGVFEPNAEVLGVLNDEVQPLGVGANRHRSAGLAYVKGDAMFHEAALVGRYGGGKFGPQIERFKCQPAFQFFRRCQRRQIIDQEIDAAHQVFSKALDDRQAEAGIVGAVLVGAGHVRSGGAGIIEANEAVEKPGQIGAGDWRRWIGKTDADRAA